MEFQTIQHDGMDLSWQGCTYIGQFSTTRWGRTIDKLAA